jgi:putative peptidoglycan lipid II flippase
MVTTKVLVTTGSAALCPSHVVVIMLSVASSTSYVVAAAAGHLLLRRRHGLLGFTTVGLTFARVVWAPAIAGVGCLSVMFVIRHFVTAPLPGHLAALAAGLVMGAATFLPAAKVIGIPELAHPTRARSLWVDTGTVSK